MATETPVPTIPELLARIEALEKRADPQALMTKSEVAAHLKMSTWNVNELMRKRAIPYLKFGYCTVRFRRADVDARLNETSLVKAGIRNK